MFPTSLCTITSTHITPAGHKGRSVHAYSPFVAFHVQAVHQAGSGPLTRVHLEVAIWPFSL